ncbi:MAG: hypothetical protein IJV25_07960 [Prevotella sp.]|nr:hypothetical protein [Prevotella sp.]
MDKYDDIQQQVIEERIDAFVRGAMTEAEEQAFKQEIKADSELRAQVLATVSMIKSIRSQEAAKEKTLISNNTKERLRTLVAWACSIAAVIAIFFGYQKDKRFNELSALVSPYYSEYNMDENARGDLDSASVAHLYTLFNNIKVQRNVSTIIAELEPIYSKIDSDFTYSAYANDIAMNLALAYIKNDQKDKAIPILKKLAEDNPDTPIEAKALELLKKMREI